MPNRCPKCRSINVYIDDGMFACRHCGERWMPEFKPYKKVKEDEMSTEKVCKNCGRTKPITGRGFCGGCYFSAKKFPVGSPEYLDALRRAKERFTDPNYKASAKKTTLKVVKQSTSSVVKQIPAQISEITALDMLIAERGQYQEKIKKITQAIEILS
jgi:PhnA Zinc-Ribbon.